ncbi:zinc finger protein CONSTANS-LIKE 3-like [Pyrus communis]|uniref:zinc finger protein CONSTANS-LIKE 3-like n=1 Tax=Pyrus communis TaxID=23211 RepID=UPI0035C16FE7
MASIPHQFYNDNSLPSDFYGHPIPVVNGENGCSTAILGGTVWSASTTCEESLVPFCDSSNAAANFDVVSPESDISSSVMAASFPELLGLSEDIAVPGTYSEYGNMGLHVIGGTPNFGGELNLPYICEQFGEDCFTGLMSADFKPFSFAGQENWAINQENQQVPTVEDQSTMKVGRYSEEERKERIDRYLKKRNQRNFNKTIKYACRKTLADRRVRVRGRFARNTDHHEEIAQKKTQSNIQTCKDQRSEPFCSSGAVQKYDEDDWLQEAVASLMYFPYVTG